MLKLTTISRPTRACAIALLASTAALAFGATPAGSRVMMDPNGNSVDVLYTFQGYTGDNGQPFVGVATDKQGNLYGAAAGSTNTDCVDYGAVYELTTNGKFKALHEFTGQDGEYPLGSVLVDKSGNIWGTTPLGPDGFNGMGIVYEVTTDGTFNTVHVFGTGYFDGTTPYSGLVADSSGNFYGTTIGGGTDDWGSVYEITPKGKESVLYSFTGGSDGSAPRGNVAMDASGNMYATTQYNGTNGTGCTGSGCGTVVKIAPDGTETTLYAFTGGSDGGIPKGGVVLDSAGNLYGTTSYGGADGYGTVFKISTGGVETTLYTFTGGGDGGAPQDALTIDKSGNLYGTTELGGVGAGGAGFGVVFKVTSNGVETPLYQFQDRGDGGNPFGALTQYKGYLYGTTAYGGDKSECHDANGFGSVFKVKR